MIWQNRPVASPTEIDAEQELELRLSARARAGAAWAFSALVARYQPPVVRYLVRLTGNTQTGYALAEQVFVRMGRRLRGPQGGRQLRLWLLRAATDAGLDAIRPATAKRRVRLLPGPYPVGLLPAVASEPRVSRILSSLGVKAPARPAEAEPPATQQFVWQSEPAEATPPADHAESGITPEQVRLRVIRAVLGELPYADAQCLALHLVAGLNQSDVAQALGQQDAVVRRRIVAGLEFFAVRYEATMERLGLGSLDDAPTPDAATPVDTLASVAEADVVDAPPIVTASAEETALPANEVLALAFPAALPASPAESQPDVTPVPAPPDAAADEPLAAAQAASAAAPESPSTEVAAEPEHTLAEVAAERTDDDTPAGPAASAEPAAPDDLDAVPPPTAAADTPADASSSATLEEEMPPPLRRAPITWRIVELERAAPGQAALASALAEGPVGPAEDEPAHASTTSARDAEAVEPSIERKAVATAVAAVVPTEHAENAHHKKPALFPAAAPVTRPLPAVVPDERRVVAAQEQERAAAAASEPEPATDAASAEEQAAIVLAAPSKRRRHTTRTRRVLSADGEAEDPGDESLWPVG